MKWFGDTAVILATTFWAVEITVLMRWWARKTANMLMLVVHLPSQLITVIWEVLTRLIPFWAPTAFGKWYHRIIWHFLISVLFRLGSGTSRMLLLSYFDWKSAKCQQPTVCFMRKISRFKKEKAVLFHPGSILEKGEERSSYIHTQYRYSHWSDRTFDCMR